MQQCSNSIYCLCFTNSSVAQQTNKRKHLSTTTENKMTPNDNWYPYYKDCFIPIFYAIHFKKKKPYPIYS